MTRTREDTIERMRRRRRPLPEQGPAGNATQPPPREFHLTTNDPGAICVIKILLEAGRAALVDREAEPDEPPPPHTCTLCDEPAAELHPHERLPEQSLCLLCWQAAERLVTGFQTAVARHEDDFTLGLRNLVKDVRSGASEPSFYRGIHG